MIGFNLMLCVCPSLRTIKPTHTLHRAIPGQEGCGHWLPGSPAFGLRVLKAHVFDERFELFFYEGFLYWLISSRVASATVRACWA